MCVRDRSRVHLADGRGGRAAVVAAATIFFRSYGRFLVVERTLVAALPAADGGVAGRHLRSAADGPRLLHRVFRHAFAAAFQLIDSLVY